MQWRRKKGRDKVEGTDESTAMPCSGGHRRAERGCCRNRSLLGSRLCFNHSAYIGTRVAPNRLSMSEPRGVSCMPCWDATDVTLHRHNRKEKHTAIREIESDDERQTYSCSTAAAGGGHRVKCVKYFTANRSDGTSVSTVDHQRSREARRRELGTGD